MRVPNREIKFELANTILSIYTTKQHSRKFSDQLPCSQAYSIAMLEKSDVAETLVKVSLVKMAAGVRCHVDRQIVSLTIEESLLNIKAQS